MAISDVWMSFMMASAMFARRALMLVSDWPVCLRVKVDAMDWMESWMAGSAAAETGCCVDMAGPLCACVGGWSAGKAEDSCMMAGIRLSSAWRCEAAELCCR